MAQTKFTHLTRRSVLAGSAAALGTVYASQAFGGNPVVETAYGRVRGKQARGALAFKGIPYGADTSGANRFMPPKPPVKWTDVKDCFDYGNAAPQGGMAEAARYGPPRPSHFYQSPIGGGRGFPESEDCLVLNVWTASTTGKRPVLFWMHGGGYTVGSGSSLWYDGTNLARKQDVVVVTINHRLNVHGFCDLSAYGERYTASGLVGTLDCIAALKWVRDNISAFGGDPSRILIHGESGGGRKTSDLMAMKPAQGLFHRAVVQSGSTLRCDTKEQAGEKASRLLAALEIGADDIDRIQSVPVDALWRAAAGVSQAAGQWRPHVDGTMMPDHPFSPTATPLSAGVPMMIGTNRTEMSVFLGLDPAVDDLDEEGLTAALKSWQFDGKEAEVVAHYRERYPDKSITELLYMITTDRGYFLDSVLQAERKAALRQAPAYYYGFYRETPVQDGRFFAPHAEEIPFVFDNLAYAERMVGPVTPEAQALADQVSGAWCSFAGTGVPSASGLPEWPDYDAETRPTMILDTQSRIENDPRGPERELMVTFGSRQERG